MKKLLLLLILSSMLAVSDNMKAQELQPQVGDGFRFETRYDIYETDVTGGNSSANRVSIPGGAKFRILNINDDAYVISFWSWDTSNTVAAGQESNLSKRNRLNYNVTANEPVNRFFIIPKAEFAGNTARMYKRWSPVLGVLTYPFKYRPLSGTFEKTFSLSLTGGYSWLPYITNPHHSVAITGGIGVSSATLNKKNTKADSGIVEDEDKAAATFSLNLIYIHDRLQIAGTIGLDKLIDGNDAGWKYDGREWFSIGIGVNIFTPDKPSTGNGNN